MKIVILAGGFGTRLGEEPSSKLMVQVGHHPIRAGTTTCSKERLTSDGQFAGYRHQGLWKCRDLLRDRDSSVCGSPEHRHGNAGERADAERRKLRAGPPTSRIPVLVIEQATNIAKTRDQD